MYSTINSDAVCPCDSMLEDAVLCSGGKARLICPATDRLHRMLEFMRSYTNRPVGSNPYLLSGLLISLVPHGAQYPLVTLTRLQQEF